MDENQPYLRLLMAFTEPNDPPTTAASILVESLLISFLKTLIYHLRVTNIYEKTTLLSETTSTWTRRNQPNARWFIPISFTVCAGRPLQSDIHDNHYKSAAQMN